MRAGLILALGISCFAPGGLAALANFDPAAHPEYQYMPYNKTWAYQSQNEFVPDENLGYRHRASAKIHHVTRSLDQVIWDITLEFDRHGNRVVPQENPGARKRFLAFYGCSFVLGTGNSGENTIPAQVAALLPEYKVYNFGIGSSGPNLHLARAEAGEFRAAIAENSGAFVYVPIDPHLMRVNGFYQESSWMAATPFYEYGDDGKLKRKGSLRSAHPWRYAIYDWVRKAQAKWFPNYAFNFPPLLAAHSRYLCDLVAATAERLKADFPDAKFLVANHPMVKLREEALGCLRERGITVLDFAAWPPDRKYMFPLDNHPNALFNREFSALLARALATNAN